MPLHRGRPGAASPRAPDGSRAASLQHTSRDPRTPCIFGAMREWQVVLGTRPAGLPRSGGIRRGATAALATTLVFSAGADAAPTLRGAETAATGTRVALSARGFPPYSHVHLERYRDDRW